MQPRILIADDHDIVRQGIRSIIKKFRPEWEICGEVTNGSAAVEAVQKLVPDIVILDITMPVMSGLDALRELRSEPSPPRFIFLTVHSEAQLAAKAIRAGARGYLLKEAAGEELIEAIRAVMAGRVYLTSHITQDILRAHPQNEEDTVLTPRQIDVLRRIAQGKRMKEVAQELGISVRTVEDHKAQLVRALGAKSTADLIKFAVRHGLVSD